MAGGAERGDAVRGQHQRAHAVRRCAEGRAAAAALLHLAAGFPDEFGATLQQHRRTIRPECIGCRHAGRHPRQRRVDGRLQRAVDGRPLGQQQALGGQDDIKVVGSVFSGAKALEFISKTPPDVVTLDVEMPGMNGLETLEQIQRLSAERPIGVVMVSAFTRRGADITVKALQAGAFDFVTKPSGPSPEVLWDW